MKVVALISGGKDSCYNMMQCVAAGHQIVALANLRPATDKDELDSYMYQTVGHQAIDLYAEAMDLPLYRRTIEGASLEIGREYCKNEGDEVEDLYHLLKLVKEKQAVEAVSVGAILSDYQRVRVENVCKRLSLQPLAYLWHRNQEVLLREMISSQIHALIIKVAAFGLDPDKHLGKTLGEMEMYLTQLSKKYGVHVCGEGGEYETFTLDCPLFKKKIVIDSMEAVVHSADAFAPVGYLRFLNMHVEDKGEQNNSLDSIVPADACPCLNYIQSITENAEEVSTIEESRELTTSNAHFKDLWDCDKLEEQGLQLTNVVLVHLYVRSMADFSAVNSVYQAYFNVNPPSRVCVEAPLSDGELLQIDCLLHHWEAPEDNNAFYQKQAMHVQSLSHWAPANIGPYSQSVKVGETVFCAGQIGLVPCTMKLVKGGAQIEASLSVGHVEKVLDAMSSGLTLNHVLLAHCYVTSKMAVSLVRKLWESRLKDQCGEDEVYGEEDQKSGPLVVSVIPRLPRDAAVEFHIIAVTDDPRHRKSFYITKDVAPGIIECEVVEASSSSSATISLSLSLPLSPCATIQEETVQSLVCTFQESLEKLDSNTSPLCFRAFYKHGRSDAAQLVAAFGEAMKRHLDQRSPALVLVPVKDLPDLKVLHVSCWLSQ